jgi:hypothetical protein
LSSSLASLASAKRNSSSISSNRHRLATICASRAADEWSSMGQASRTYRSSRHSR